MPNGRVFIVVFEYEGTQYAYEVSNTDKPGAKAIAQRAVAHELDVKISKLTWVSTTEITKKEDQQ